VLDRCDVAAVGAVTAVTAQSHTGVRAIHTVPAHIVREQIAAALADYPVRAIKIGMLATAEISEAVADSLRKAAFAARIPIVLDPVLAASSGGTLLDAAGQAVLQKQLFPLATLITPNIPEAAALLHTAPAADEASTIEQARALLKTGAQAILLKGGHSATTECTDILVTASGNIELFTARRFAHKPRGTGCALASAVAAGLARGMPLIEACRFAKHDLTTEIAALEPAA
jgi:hydroxymethylpyrimidine/phosphomethylpyrimidine kinase